MAYIDKNLLLKDISESVVFTVRDAETSPELRGARKIIDRIKNAPTADVVEVKKIKSIRDDLKWWLETNTEKGVVYIPNFVVENMIAKMDSQL